MNLLVNAQNIIKNIRDQRSYWSVRYVDGKEVCEWERDWSQLNRKGLREVRLHCPNGQIAVLGNSVDASDRLFQFKIGSATVGMGQRTLAHVIGCINDINGGCSIYVWEYLPNPRLLGPLDENVENFSYGGPATNTINYPILGAKPD